jgi:hydroxymethylpyrimidine pyrophosphatase-like HAD family hydrolase
MDFLALATDYDGTLAKDGHVATHVARGLERVRRAGLKTLLVTGRQLPELGSVFDRFDLFDVIVAENGALLYWVGEDREEILGEPPTDPFLAEMKRLDVTPFAVGKVVFATWRPHETAVADAIARLGLKYQIIFNKRAVMVLPTSISKATGLAAALKPLGIVPAQVVGVGDAENDLAFLRMCGVAAAVDNALETVKAQCGFVALGDHGDGVLELIDALLAGSLEPRRAIDAAASNKSPAK